LLANQPPFSPAVAGRQADPAAGMQLHWLADADPASENRRVVAIAREELARRPDQSIGILVRSRNHLRGLRQALADAGLSAHAIEIDSLADTAVGQDLLAFTSSLLHPADRLAWLGLLRGPCCGVGWQDLAVLCGDDFESTIPELLANPARLQRMSAAGRERAGWLWRQLEAGAAWRSGCTLGRWLERCWQMIGGAGSDPASAEHALVRNYFDQIDRLSRHGDIDDPAELQHRFSRPDGHETPRASGIELMTIHRAKGLEFDAVILPGLARTARGSSSNLLFFREIYLPSGEHLNLAAVHAEPEDALMSYLRHRDREQEAAERIRLLYVAMTRARQRLHLIAGADPDSEPPRSGSLLASLLPGLNKAEAGDATGLAAAQPAMRETPEFVSVQLRRRIRLPASQQPESETREATASSRRPDFEWVNPASVQVGTVIHRELHRLTQAAAVRGQPVAPVIDDARYRSELALLGVESADLAEAAYRVGEALARVWDDATGRWILFPHAEAWSEQRITIRARGTLEHLRLDRSFIDDAGQRWIIDYKTGRHLGANVDEFLAAEVDRYRAQLERYAAAVAAFDNRPIRLGLYFPLLMRLRDWVPSSAQPLHNVPG